jgi:hypothetical protein
MSVSIFISHSLGVVRSFIPFLSSSPSSFFLHFFFSSAD